MERGLWLALLVITAALAGCTTAPPDDGGNTTDGDDGSDDPDGTDGAGGKVAREPVDVSHCEDPEPIDSPSWPVAVLETNMGTIEVELFLEAVPITVTHFVCLVEAGFYDHTEFHRIISDFMMQGGDPNTLDLQPGNDGQGGPGYTIPDEFHHLLRHEGKGVLSMANSGPNSGGSQFFITFAATPWLDDKHTVFGQVTNGMDVVDQVNAEVATGNGEPQQRVVIEDASIRYEEMVTTPAFSFDFWVPISDHAVPEDGGTTHYLAVLESGANQRMDVDLWADAPEGVAVMVEEAFRSFVIPAQQRVAFLVEATLDEASPGSATITLHVGDEASDQSYGQATLTLGKDPSVGPAHPSDGDSVKVDYVGLTVDGRVFDTSVQAAGEHAVENDVGYGPTGYQNAWGFQGRSSYGPATFPVNGVVTGFSQLLKDTPEGGDNAARLPPELAYGSGPCQRDPCFSGRTLLFQASVIEINPE